MLSDKDLEVAQGTLTWRMGRFWEILEPNDDGTYSSDNIRHSKYPPKGITKYSTGKGSCFRTLQIIGDVKSIPDTDIDLGWAKIHITMKGGKPTMTFTGGTDAIKKRWDNARLNKGITTNPPKRHRLYGFLNKRTRTKLATETALMQQISPTWAILRSDIYIRDKGICWLCNTFVELKDYELGHLVDRVNGGKDTYDNLVVMHKLCNLSKPPHKTLEEAVRWKLIPRHVGLRPLPEPLY